ncbi:hypothetical protein [Paracoccus cavernae]|uniref:hypothetical protein n=1 Tax=Paracoccus cavernae TaxID=1571207 RepID=UPI00362950BF
MDRKEQLRNVAFGGAWSEQIAEREALVLALACLLTAADRSATDDLRLETDVVSALWRAGKDHPKGEMLIKAWERATEIPNGGLRRLELVRIARLLEDGQRARLT